MLKIFENGNTVCNECNTSYKKKKLKEAGHYFISISLKSQLAEIVKSKLYLEFRKECDEFDVVNGQAYKELRKDKIIGDNDITIQWNTDGVNFFKSSKCSMWPILVTINELNYRTRKNNVILCGLWYGRKKPCMNMYLEPFIEELDMLEQEGMSCESFTSKEEIRIKVHALVSPLDSVARPMVQNVKQFNGTHGCSYCEQKGEQIPVGNGTARVYVYTDQMTSRSSSEHESHVKIATDTGKPFKGVKGPSITELLSILDIIDSYPPEYMHCCLLGIILLFVLAWFDSKNHNKPYYLGSKKSEFNEFLMSNYPPTEVSRVPKPLDDKFNANDWRTLALYYSMPGLKSIMKTKYYNHWHLFVFALNIFLKENISDENLKQAESAFKIFVQDTQKLYGKEFMKYNLHLLLHIPKYVRMYGALWAWSAFPFEGFNGVMRSLFHGTQYVPEQICKATRRLRYIRNNSQVFDNDDCHKKTVNLFLKLMKKCKVKNCIEYSNDLKIFGKSKAMTLSLVEQVLIEQLLNEPVEIKCQSFHRFIYKHRLFHSSSYKKLKKRNNSTILTFDGTIMSISSLVKVRCTTSHDIKCVLLGKKFNILDERLCRYRNFDSNLYSFIATETSSIMCCDCSSVKAKCIVTTYKSDKKCIIPIVNTLETD